MILSGIGTHIYNEKQDKEAQAEMERERIRLGYGSWVPELEQADSQRCANILCIFVVCFCIFLNAVKYF